MMNTIRITSSAVRMPIVIHCRLSEMARKKTKVNFNFHFNHFHQSQSPTICDVHQFGHFLHCRVQFRLRVAQLVSKVVQHDRVLVQLLVDLAGHGLERAHRVADHVQLLVLALEHLLLHRHRVAHEARRRTVHQSAAMVTRTVLGVLQLRVLGAAVTESRPTHTHYSAYSSTDTTGTKNIVIIICINIIVHVVDMNGVAEAGAVVQQRLSCGCVSSDPVQAHPLLEYRLYRFNQRF